MNEPIHIAFGLDRHYLEHLPVVLASIRGNSQAAIEFHLICEQEIQDAVDEVLSRIEPVTGWTYQMHEIKKENTKQFWTSKHITRATYYRIFLGRLLAARVKKVIYLDLDLVVLKDISGLWKTDIADAPLAAVPHYIKEGVPDLNYFNAGVLLINMARWRAENYEEKLTQYIRKFDDEMTNWDQEALNAVFKDIWYPLEQAWNVTARDSDELRDAGIVHFVGSHKPWNYYCTHPAKELYHGFRAKAGLSPIYFEQDTIVWKIRNWVKGVVPWR